MADQRKKDEKSTDKDKKGKATDKPPVGSIPNLELPKDSGPDSGIEPIEVVEVVEDDDVEVVHEAEPEGLGTIRPGEKGPESGRHAMVSDEDILIDDSDLVEVLPSSASIIDAPLVEEAEAEVVYEVEPVSDIHKTAPLGTGPDSGTLKDEPQDIRAEDVIIDADDILVEGESEIELGKKSGSKGDRPSGVDMIAEALESGVDLGHAKQPAPPVAKEKTGSDSDIDLESILDDSAESSAVDLAAPGKKTSMPASPVPQSGHTRGEVGGEGEGEGDDHVELVGVEDSAEGAEIIDESILLDSAEAEDDDAELVRPKKKVDAEAEEEVVAAAEHDEFVEAVVDEPAPAVVEPAAAKKGRDRDKELVGAGGGRRGGFMPFLFGGLLAIVLAAGGGGAAWYLNLLPESPSAPPRSTAKSLPKSVPAYSQAEEALQLFIEGKNADALELVAKAPDKSPAGAVKTLVNAYEKNAGKAGGGGDVEALEKAVADAKAKNDELQQQQKALEKAKNQSDIALQEINAVLANAGLKDPKGLGDLVAAAKDSGALIKERDTLAKDRDALAKDREAAVKDRDNAENARKTLAAAVDAALAELKEGNYLGNDPDPLKQLVEGSKKARQSGQSPLGSSLGGLLGAFGGMAKAPGDVFKQALDSAKLSAALAAAKAQTAFAETPDHRLDLIVAVLGNRGYNDATEMDAFKRYIDWVRSKDSNVPAETRTKALLAEALLQRNQQNLASARQTLEQAMKEAQTLKDGTGLQTAAAQALKSLTAPATTSVANLDSKVAAGQFKEALDELNAALKATPENPQLYLRRAQVAVDAALASGKIDAAAQQRVRDDAEAARKDATLAAESFFLVGRLEEHNNQLAKAEEYYRAAAKLAGVGQQGDRYRAALARVLLRERTAGFPGIDELPEDDDNENCAFLDGDEVAATQQASDGPEDAAARRRLEETIKIAEELIQADNPKTQGEGYMLLGAAQAKLGKMTEGLKNLVKGLRLTNPDWSTQELDRIVNNHPAFRQPEVVAQPNPLMADKHFSKGLELFWMRNYAGAESEFTKAISFYDEDARYRYFLGLSRYLQGTAQKRKQAESDFEKGVQLEQSRHPSTREVNASLERIQGDLRTLLNRYRERPQ